METYNFMMTGLHLQQIAKLVNIPEDTMKKESTDSCSKFKTCENQENEANFKRAVPFGNVYQNNNLKMNHEFQRRMVAPYSIPNKGTDKRNERERNRVKTVNSHFKALQEHVPKTLNRNGKVKKMSKVDILRSAVDYIHHLQDILKQDDEIQSSQGTKGFSSMNSSQQNCSQYFPSASSNTTIFAEEAHGSTTFQYDIEAALEGRSLSPSSYTSSSMGSSMFSENGFTTESASPESQIGVEHLEHAVVRNGDNFMRHGGWLG